MIKKLELDVRINKVFSKSFTTKIKVLNNNLLFSIVFNSILIVPLLRYFKETDLNIYLPSVEKYKYILSKCPTI